MKSFSQPGTSLKFQLVDNNSDTLPDRWDKLELSWRVSRLPSRGLTEEEVRQTIAEALSIWARHSTLSFTYQSQGKVDLDVRSVRERFI